MKFLIDQNLCSGHGRCYTLSPELVHADDDGFPQRQGEEIEVPAGLEDAARKLVANCPEGAISLIGE